MLGFAPEELVGRGAHEAVHSRRADGSPYPEAECRMVRALERGEPCRVDDELLWRKDGTGLPVEYRATPMRKGGEVVGAVVSFTDITERKVRDDAFRAVWNMPGEAVVLFDENGFADGNASWLRMMEYDSISEIVGKMPYELSPELQPDGRGSREAGEEFVRQAIADGTVRFEYVHQTRSGRPLPLDIALSATTLNGRPAFVSLSRDLSERNAAQAELKRRAEELELAHFQADTALELTPRGLLARAARRLGLVQLLCPRGGHVRRPPAPRPPLPRARRSGSRTSRRATRRPASPARRRPGGASRRPSTARSPCTRPPTPTGGPWTGRSSGSGRRAGSCAGLTGSLPTCGA